MKKQEHLKQLDQQLLYRKNKGRLIQQNRQLHTQIFLLQTKVSSLLSKKFSNEFQQVQSEKVFNQKHKNQTKDQINLMKKLKKKILLIKNIQKPQQKQHLRKAEDQLKFLKSQKIKLLKQKQALQKQRNLKNQSLQLNKPIEQQRKRMRKLYHESLRENNELRTQTIKIQKQIINLHQVRELAKTSSSLEKTSQNINFEINKIQNEISKLKQQTKKIQKQWQPKLQSLDKEYFYLKSIKSDRENQIECIDKKLNLYKNRISVVKQQAKILEDKLRVSQIKISPLKRNQIRQKLQSQRKQIQFFQSMRKGIQKDSRKGKKDNQQHLTKKESRHQQNSYFSQDPNFYMTQIVSKQNQPEKDELHNQFSHQTKNTVIQQNNQFSHENTKKINQQDCYEQQQLIQTSPNKFFTSIAVGTTFYYNQEND